MTKRGNYLGQTFGKWTVIEDMGKVNGVYKWKCRCECGKIGIHTIGMLNLKHRSNSCIDCSNITDIINDTYWRHIVYSAKKRKIEFSITKDYLTNIWLEQNGRCKYTNIPLSLKKGKRTGSLDRIDSTKGYIENNVQFVHKDINFMKHTLSDKRLRYYANLISGNMEYENINNSELPKGWFTKYSLLLAEQMYL